MLVSADPPFDADDFSTEPAAPDLTCMECGEADARTRLGLLCLDCLALTPSGVLQVGP